MIAGQALARLDGVVRRIVAGTFLVVPPHVRHSFINDDAGPFRMLWLLVPPGLEDFFVGIGRPKRPGEPDPTPFSRPVKAQEIELATVFEALDPPAKSPWDTAPIADSSVLEASRREAV